MTRAAAESGNQISASEELRENVISFIQLSRISAVRSVKTDMLPSGAISRLYIANANRHDSGNYSCGKLDASSIPVSLFVAGPSSEKLF